MKDKDTPPISIGELAVAGLVFAIFGVSEAVKNNRKGKAQRKASPALREKWAKQDAAPSDMVRIMVEQGVDPQNPALQGLLGNAPNWQARELEALDEARSLRQERHWDKVEALRESRSRGPSLRQCLLVDDE